MVCRAVRSVLQCERPDIEVVVVDDGSTDGTIAQLSQIADERSRLHRLESAGNANRARNFGASLARSQLISFLDSDDTFRVGRIDRLIDFFSARPDVDCLIDGYIEFSRGRTRIHRMPQTNPDREVLRYMLVAHTIPLTNSAITLRRSAFETIGGYDESMPRHHDRDLLLRLGRDHSIRLGDEADVEKYRSANSISHEFDGYIEGLSALAERVPELYLPENQSLFSYLIVRGILKAIATGNWSAATRELRKLRSAERLPGGFMHHLARYSMGRRQRHRYLPGS